MSPEVERLVSIVRALRVGCGASSSDQIDVFSWPGGTTSPMASVPTSACVVTTPGGGAASTIGYGATEREAALASIDKLLETAYPVAATLDSAIRRAERALDRAAVKP